MKDSALRTLRDYFQQAILGLLRMLNTLRTSVPYIVGRGELRKEVTEEYPDPVSSRTREDLPNSFRGLLFNDIDKCTGCGECVQVCPTDCIYLSTEPGPSRQKLWVAQFDVDFGKCVFCGLCTEVCEPDSLVHTTEFEGASLHMDGLLGRFGRGSVSKELREKWKMVRESEGVATEW